jgi:hypothetical protein
MPPDDSKSKALAPDRHALETPGPWAPLSGTVIRAVSRFETLCEAFRLAHDHRVRSGLIAPHPSRMDFTVYQLFPFFSKSWAAYVGGRMVGTGTVAVHTPAGLPSSGKFGSSFSRMRRAGRTAAEGSILVCNHFCRSRVRSITLALVATEIDWALAVGVDEFYTVANRGQVPFLRDKIGFEMIEEAEGPGGHPAVLLRLDLKAFHSREDVPSGTRTAGLPLGWRRHFSSRSPHDSIQLAEEEVALLLLSRPEFKVGLTSAQRGMLRSCFPNALWIAERNHLFCPRIGASAQDA